MILQWQSPYLGVDPPCPTEFGDLEFDRGRAKIFAVKIQITAVKIPLFRASERRIPPCSSAPRATPVKRREMRWPCQVLCRQIERLAPYSVDHIFGIAAHPNSGYGQVLEPGKPTTASNPASGQIPSNTQASWTTGSISYSASSAFDPLPQDTPLSVSFWSMLPIALFSRKEKRFEAPDLIGGMRALCTIILKAIVPLSKTLKYSSSYKTFFNAQNSVKWAKSGPENSQLPLRCLTETATLNEK